MRSPLLIGVLLATTVQAQATGAPNAEVAALLAQADDAYAHRDEPGRIEAMREALDRAEKASPNDYGVLWRQARMYFWISDDPKMTSDEKSRLGKRAWEYGDRAAAVNPNGVEGWYFGAVGMGNYSLGIGILKALSEGIEGKYRERLSKAEKIDPKFLNGGIYTAWGRFYFKLPWPKYDARRSEQALLKSIEINPEQIRAKVYLADLYAKEGHEKEAWALLQEAAAHKPGSYDPPEERRAQAEARKQLESMK
jgi:hypothetical protein